MEYLPLSAIIVSYRCWALTPPTTVTPSHLYLLYRRTPPHATVSHIPIAAIKQVRGVAQMATNKGRRLPLPPNMLRTAAVTAPATRFTFPASPALVSKSPAEVDVMR